MGIKGASTCVMNYDGAIGYLIGEPHRGMHAMFSMMNYERLMVGQQGLALAEVAYQNAANYARDRLQGRSLKGPVAPELPADPIIVHPDVRRMLLTTRAYNEAARALLAWVSLQVDRSTHHPDPAVREAAGDAVSLFTPVVKAFFTDYGFESCNQCQQVFGGHGYISEWGMEQLVRDARIAQIYEGANGIHALDLAGRKLSMNGGRAIQAYMDGVSTFVAERRGKPELEEFVEPLGAALGRLEQATQWLNEAAKRGSGRDRRRVVRLPPAARARRVRADVGRKRGGRACKPGGGQLRVLPCEARDREVLRAAPPAQHRLAAHDAARGRGHGHGHGGRGILSSRGTEPPA